MSIYKDLNDMNIDLEQYEEQNLTNFEKKKWEKRILKKISKEKPSHVKKYLGVTAAVAMIFSLIIVTGLISPTMAATMKEVPLLSSVFKFTRDLGLHAADEKGLSTKLNTSVTHEGFTLNVTEVVYDGTRVAIGIERHQKKVKIQKKVYQIKLVILNFY